MSADHRMYRHPPVALVAVEIRFPGEIGAPVPSGVQRAFGEVLGDGWVLEPLPQVSYSVNVGASAGSPLLTGAQGTATSAMARYTVRDRTTAVALTAGSVTVETTRYGNWPQFREVLAKAVEAAGKLLRPDGVTRIGVRYIDEVRVPDKTGINWEEWLSATVLPPGSQALDNCGWLPLNWTGISQYRTSEERYLVSVMDHNQPFQVSPSILTDRSSAWVRSLSARSSSDFDAYWQASVIPGWTPTLPFRPATSYVSQLGLDLTRSSQNA